HGRPPRSAVEDDTLGDALDSCSNPQDVDASRQLTSGCVAPVPRQVAAPGGHVLIGQPANVVTEEVKDVHGNAAPMTHHEGDDDSLPSGVGPRLPQSQGRCRRRWGTDADGSTKL